jgi:hypothetical protein
MLEYAVYSRSALLETFLKTITQLKYNHNSSMSLRDNKYLLNLVTFCSFDSREIFFIVDKIEIDANKWFVMKRIFLQKHQSLS